MNRLLALLVRHGTPLVWLNVFLEQIGAPIPAVPTLIVAGALSRDGKLSSTSIIAGSVIASLVADYIWFLLGRRLGYRVLKTMCRISLSPDSCVRDTEARFERWGLPSLLFAKFVPGFSTIAPPLAGATNRGTLPFLIYDGIGAFVWAGAAVAAGHVFHRAIDRVLGALEDLGYWAVVFIASALTLVIIVKWYQRFRFLQQLRLARITPDELRALMNSNVNPVVIDARTEGARRRQPQTIPTAIVAAAAEIEQRLKDLPRDREIIVYCT